MPNRRCFLGALLGGLAALKLRPKAAAPAMEDFRASTYLYQHPSRFVYVDALTGREYPVRGMRSLVDDRDQCESIHRLQHTVTWTHLPPGTRPLLLPGQKK